ncbi:MAG: GT4 family glycosyltransferase PelF [Alicyclobacillus sp.]|nr:GT4 family glycosyltransferase PelF [Alicyclobacillus sp.]
MNHPSDKISVLLCTEGTYPFHQGGVSTWCHALVQRLRNVDFTVYSIVTDPFVTQKFTLPRGTGLLKLPLWGTDEASEHLDVPFSSTYLAKLRTTPEVVQTRFLPLFDDFIRELVRPDKQPFSFAATLVKMADFFQEFDYKVAFKSSWTWNRYKHLMEQFSTGSEAILPKPDLFGLIQSLGWVYRFFNIINTRVPETTVTHAAAAAFCGLPGVIAKEKYQTPMLLTEHGVYTREQYLSLSKRGYSSFLNTFLIRMVHAVVKVTYAYADQISPVCLYNTRWEKRLTDRHERIRVIHNGVDHRVFAHIEPRDHDRPTVVTIARIDPIKDILTLIRAAGIVRRQIPNVRFIVYGSTTVPEYGEKCLALVDELGLGKTVEFFGHTTDMAAAYDSGDIVVQSSISEAFPYSVIEAMMSGKPVISTDVGGVPEALGDTGILVTPGASEELAAAIVRLLGNRQAQLDLGQQARRRAMDLFTLDRCLEQYLKSYIQLALSRALPERPAGRTGTAQAGAGPARASRPGSRSALVSQQVLLYRALALKDSGHPDLAVQQLLAAVAVRPDAPVTPVLLDTAAAWLRTAGCPADAELLGLKSELVERLLSRPDRREGRNDGTGAVG